MVRALYLYSEVHCTNCHTRSADHRHSKLVKSIIKKKTSILPPYGVEDVLVFAHIKQQKNQNSESPDFFAVLYLTVILFQMSLYFSLYRSV